MIIVVGILGLIAIGIICILYKSILNPSTVIAPIPSQGKHRKIVVELLTQLSLPLNIRICEVGSGWGGFSKELVKAGFNYTGVEINPFLVLICKLRSKLLHSPAQFICSNIYNIDLTPYQVFIIYMNNDFNEAFLNYLHEHKITNVYLVTSQFKMQSLVPIKEYNSFLSHVYVYKV